MITEKDLEQYRLRWIAIDQYTEEIRLCKQRLLRFETSAGFQNSQDPILRQNYNETKAELQNTIKKINESLKKITENSSKIGALIDSIPDPKVRQVMKQYYVLGAEDMNDVEATLNLSKRTAQRRRAKGLQMIEELQK